jgi:hypothetical protein
MQVILSGFTTIMDYLAYMNDPIHKCQACLRRCNICGLADALHRHGSYPRKPDRSILPGTETLNPVPIQRYICKNCGVTCSELPECIPPRRWYPWEVQQFVIEERLLGKTWDLISEVCGASVKTCRRWFNQLRTQCASHADVLRNVAGSLCEVLASSVDFKSFWQKCFSEISLARSMLLCHQAKITVP